MLPGRWKPESTKEKTPMELLNEKTLTVAPPRSSIVFRSSSPRWRRVNRWAMEQIHSQVQLNSRENEIVSKFKFNYGLFISPNQVDVGSFTRGALKEGDSAKRRRLSGGRRWVELSFQNPSSVLWRKRDFSDSVTIFTLANAGISTSPCLIGWHTTMERRWDTWPVSQNYFDFWPGRS